MKINHNSRFANYSRNMFFAFVSQAITVVLGFVSRRVFVNELDAVYLGMSGLFSSILTVLSLSEMGVGTAIIYALYKPIKEFDNEKIKSLMALYRKVYWIIGVVILLLGGLITPALPQLVKEMPDIPEIYFIYLMFVLQSSIGYFFSYKISFLSATQKSYQVRFFDIITSIFQTILQIGSLLIFHNYIVYLAISIVCPFIKNVVVTIIVNKQYPFLKEKASKLSKEEEKGIRKNVLAMFIYKVSSTLSSTIDTILVSLFMGIVEVGIYSNYHLIISYSNQLFSTVLGTITPSLGNFFVSNDDEKKIRLLNTLQLVYYWLGTYLAVGLVVLFNPFIELWLGKEYLFSPAIVVALVVSVTLTNFQRPCALVRDANGLFWQGKLRPLAMSIINIVSSVIFVYWFGTIGVVLGTILAKLCTYVWYDPYIVAKHAFPINLKKYFLKYTLHWAALIGFATLCQFIQNATKLTGVFGLIVGFVQVTIIVNVGFLLIYGRTDEFKYLLDLIKGVVNKKILKRQKQKE